MGLFDKKYCSICEAKIGLFGNRKLEDGNCCKDCAAKLSPFFSERRHSTVADIEEQLQYREENKAEVEAFHPTRTLGRNYMVLIDEDQRKFIVTNSKKYKDVNPDVISLSQVTGCELEIDEDKHEVYMKDKEGNNVSFNPPRYEYDYDFYMHIYVEHKYFDEIRVKLNSSDVDGHNRVAYEEFKDMGKEIKEALTAGQVEARQERAAAAAPKQAVVCPFCGATTTPDRNGCCEYCGGAVN